MGPFPEAFFSKDLMRYLLEILMATFSPFVILDFSSSWVAFEHVLLSLPRIFSSQPGGAFITRSYGFQGFIR
jgi:hypothetical protein